MQWFSMHWKIFKGLVFQNFVIEAMLWNNNFQNRVQTKGNYMIKKARTLNLVYQEAEEK